MSDDRYNNTMTLTPLQAYDALLRYLKLHADKMHSSDIDMLYGWARYDRLTRAGYPMSLDPREFDEWLDCVEAVVGVTPGE